ncbi:hypothetical protein [Flexivirga alba]|uniref:YfhO family protein n=1 Tax=Flexivirga alba TaxID=702742 RepID=A0ABW2AEN6_9MICO
MIQGALRTGMSKAAGIVPDGFAARLATLTRRPGVLSVTCVIVSILLGNAAFLLHLRNSNPMLLFSGLGSPRHGLVMGSSTIDPNYGWTSQALGHLAANSWLHGHVPLWNVYEGLGQPLGGEMQSAAFFLPFVLLQALPNGIFLMHVALEFVAGFSMLAFLRSRRLGWAAATAGACLFALNGVFSVMANAPFNPIAFLPMACWGVELIARAVEQHRRPHAGLWVTAFAFAFMLFAGFPETALLEGLFVGGWAVVRLTELLRGLRRAFAAWTVVATGAGLAIAAPAITAFVAFIDVGYTAYHGGAANLYSYPRAKVTSLALPYAVGPMGNAISAGQAGYLTLTAVTVGIVAFFRPRGRRVMLAFLGVLVAVLVLNMFDVSPVKQLLDVTPGVRNVLVAKYGIALIEFAVAICAAYGIDDLRRGRASHRGVLVAVAAVGVYCVGALGYAAHRGVLGHAAWTTVVMTVTLGCCGVLAILLLRAGSSSAGAALGGRRRCDRRRVRHRHVCRASAVREPAPAGRPGSGALSAGPPRHLSLLHTRPD